MLLAFPMELVPLTAPTPENFIPPGWALAGLSGAEARPLTLAAGGTIGSDLTGDGVADRVLVLEPTNRVGAGAVVVAECTSCEAQNWPRTIMVLEAVGGGWMRLGVATWGDASATARIVDGGLVVTGGRSSGSSEALHALYYRVQKGTVQLNKAVHTRSEFSEDEPKFQRITEDWITHERVVERGDPPSFERKETFTGSRTLATPSR